MKIKSMLATALLLTGLIGADANAVTCTLKASTSYVPIGQPFSYRIGILGTQFGPVPPATVRPYTVVFFGTKNGVSDISSSGETYPATFPFGYSTLTGYANVGGFTGNYVRYALIYREGLLQCVTNAVGITLE